MNFVLFLGSAVIVFLFQGHWFLSQYMGLIGVIFLLLLALVVPHTIYVLLAELRDHSLRREIERERRWRILEQLSTLPEPQRTLTQLMLDEEGVTFDQLEDWHEKPKRNEYSQWD